MGHQATIVDQRVTTNTSCVAIVVKHNTFITLFLVASTTIVGSFLDKRVLLSVLIVLRAMSREAEFHTLAVIVVERGGYLFAPRVSG